MPKTEAEAIADTRVLVVATDKRTTDRTDHLGDPVVEFWVPAWDRWARYVNARAYCGLRGPDGIVYENFTIRQLDTPDTTDTANH